MSPTEKAATLFRQGYSEAEVMRKVVGLSASDAVRIGAGVRAESASPPAVIEHEAEAAPPPAPPRQRGLSQTSMTLRSMLFDEIASLRSGKTTPKQALAVATLASTICDTVKLEIVAAQVAATGRRADPLKLTQEPD